MKLSEKLGSIKSLQQTMSRAYVKPDPERLTAYALALEKSKVAKKYLEDRGLTEKTIQYFQLGYDTEKNAITIPHFKDGVLTNFKFRHLEGDLRYTNEKDAEPWVFHEDGIGIGKEMKGIAIAEGEFDAMSLYQAGFKNVISPGSGANSYGVWIELLDKIPQVYIAYDNDPPGQQAAKELAERVGVEKCKNVQYTDVKDANEYLLKHKDPTQSLRELFAKATPFYKYEFNNLQDVLTDMISTPRDYITTKYLPDVRIYKDNLTVLSGVTNSGKSTIALNIAIELAEKGIPVLILPLERGTYTVGRRLIQVALGKTEEDIEFTPKVELIEETGRLVRLPIYFAMPDKFNMEKTIIRAKRLFGVQYVIIDQIDQAIRNLSGNREIAISDTVRNIKQMSEQQKIAILIVTHIRKLSQGEHISMDALKGSNSLSTDPETVALIDRGEDAVDEHKQHIKVIIAKNKGKMSTKDFNLNPATGVVTDDYDPDDW